MFGMVLLLLFGRLQELSDGAAWKWAAAYAVLSGLPFLGGGSAVLLSAAVGGLYAWGYFALLRRVADRLLLWLPLYLGGALLPLLISVAAVGAASGT